MKDKKSIKNYIILGVIVIITLFVTMLSLNIYRNYVSTNNSFWLKDTIMEVKEEELKTFLLERDMVILYTCDVTNNKCRSFEKRIKNNILNNDLRDEIFYYNTSNPQDFYNSYKSENLYKKIYGVPTVFIIKNSKIIDVLSSKSSITAEQFRLFLEDYTEEC
jgi:hypothetical protein